MDDQNFEYGLMPEEIELFEQFKNRHRNCDPERREACIEEDVAPILFAIELCMSSIGMSPTAVCYICGQRNSIACEKRINSF
jgi:hypothetical protein